MTPSGRPRSPGRVATVAAVLAATSLATACGTGHSGGTHGAASITINHDRRALTVTSCTGRPDAVHVVAQTAGGWTLDLRDNGAAGNALLVLVHNAASGVRSYQASANVLHPHGNPPSRITVEREGTRLTGTATLLSVTGKHTAKRRTTAASFDIHCADVTPLPTQ